MQEAKGRGYGKVILFGEYFSVYGTPGAAAGIDKYVEVKATKHKDAEDVIIDDQLFFKEKVSLKENPEHIKIKGLKAMFKDEIEISLKGFKLTYSGNLPHGEGMGFGSALGAATARAVSSMFDMKLKDEKINELAQKWDSATNGTPSEIDDACATYDSLVWFEKNKEDDKVKARPFKSGGALFLIIGETGIKKQTPEALAEVKKWKEENKSEFEKILSEAKKLSGKAKLALKFGEMAEIGKLMNQNQELLKKIGASLPEQEALIKIALEKGAYGAKITGTGSGNIIALCENEAMQDKIIATIEQRGYKAIKTRIH